MNTKIYLASYDIESDKLRTKIADKLLYFGLERMQYSVFWGPLKASTLKALYLWCAELPLGDQDKIAILPLHREQLPELKSFGALRMDVAMREMERDILIL